MLYIITFDSGHESTANGVKTVLSGAGVECNDLTKIANEAIERGRLTMATTSYDAVPYESVPFAKTRPENLYTIGRLFGVDAPDFRSARVLELGCASGGNLIPMALEYPDATCVGIDLSSVQIEEGRIHSQALGLKNLKLKSLSILDIKQDLGIFDYIICHGILSWVPALVQDKIFHVVKDHLSANGIAYISYNTLPGWNMVKSLREMMFYHTDRFDDPATKAVQARALLSFIDDALTDTQSAHREAIKYEINLISKQPDSYLLHDHMEETNVPFYFHEFMARASEVGLQYLAEDMLPSMYSGNLPVKTQEVLKTSEDLIRTEQYMDFISNRRFRSTLLCHEGIQLNRLLDGPKIEEFHLSTVMARDDEKESDDAKPDGSATFKDPVGGAMFSAPTPIPTILAQTLVDARQKPIDAGALIEKVRDDLELADGEPVRQVLHKIGMQLVLAGAVQLHSCSGNYILDVSRRPIASRLARYQATYASWVTNQKHERINVDIFDAALLQQLDGKKDLDALSANILRQIEEGKLSIQQHGKQVEDKDVMRPLAREVIEATLQSFALKALLLPSAD